MLSNIPEITRLQMAELGFEPRRLQKPGHVRDPWNMNQVFVITDSLVNKGNNCV